MIQQTTDFGLSCLGHVPWGTHVCQFYDGPSQMFEVAIPYVATGLLQNQSCIWVCAGDDGVTKAAEALSRTVPDLPNRLSSGQIRLLPHRDWYLAPDGTFDGSRVLRQWRQGLTEAASAGYQGLRVLGDTSWLDESLWPEFDKYEARIYGSIAQDTMLALCLYPRNGNWVPNPLDVAKSHQYALVRRDSSWSAVNYSRQWDSMWMSLFDSLTDGLMLVDETGRIRAANAGMLSLFCVRSLRDLGQNLSQFAGRFGLQNESGASASDFAKAMLSTPGSQQYWKVQAAQFGREMHLRVYTREVFAPLLLSRLYTVVFEDITELRRMVRARDQMLRFLSHEFRNPLQVMKTAADLGSKTDANGSVPGRYMAILKRQIDLMSALADDALTAFRIGDDRLVIDREMTDLVDLVREWLDSLVIPPGYTVDSDLPSWVRAPANVDRTRVTQVLANMLSNAIKFSAPGSRVLVKVQVSAEDATVTVEDEGIGVPEEELSMVFQPFFRASNAAPVSGTGLGLYISRELARLHGGDLWLERSPEAGTVARLRLPLASGGSRTM